ncbi:MAG: hypothetical protein NZ602_12700 [Thermoguttaceae bacterium]|nr:hypothetical protein [Thermoguttaceae bacterium]MDW8039641.1 hypothetical protein [Thermoguttaceae bacterium]
MNSILRNQYNGTDPMGWIEELRQALCASELEEFDLGGPVSARAKEAAYEVAVALGRCRIFGLKVPEDLDGVLPEPEAIAAAQVATQKVRQWAEDARQLPERWDEADPFLAQAMCAELLEACMESYFAMEALSESLLARWKDGSEAVALFQSLDELSSALQELDALLQEPDNLALLSTVVELPLLNNWREMLAEPYKSCPPWWLDGTLEAVDRKIEEVCRRTLPAGEDWRRLVEGRPKWRQPAELPPQEEPALLRPAVLPRHRSREIFQIRFMYAAAAETPAAWPPIKTFLQWTSPDSRFRARLSIPAEATENTMLVMEFLTPQEELATDLGGQPVWLAGVEAYIEPAGLARFPLHRLREQLGQPEAELILEVGPERTEWPAVENS